MNDTKTEIISIRVTPAVREMIKKGAKGDNRSVTNYLVNLVIAANRK